MVAVANMNLCTYSKSEVLVHSILPDCPLSLSSTEAKKCQCRKRLYNQGPAHDLRVLSCTFPLTWNGKEIRNPQAFAMMIRADQRAAKTVEAAGEYTEFQFTNESEDEVSTMSEERTEPEATPTAEQSLSTALGPAMHLPSLYDRIADPLDFVNKLGTALFQSKMFGCNNADQGRVLALACLSERKSPLALKRSYHIIGGNLTMRADAMLADFVAGGGSYDIVHRTPECAEIHLQKGRKKAQFKFTWEEAKLEDYVYTQDANNGKVKKDSPAALKDNWKTPRRRMQMLWARVVSDGIRAFDPGVNAGSYTPEELGGGVEDADVIDAVYTPVPANGHPATETTATAAPPSRPSPVTVAPASPAPKPPTQPPVPAATAEPTIEAPSEPMVAREQLVEMKRLKEALNIQDAGWLKLIGTLRPGAVSAKQLTHAEADRGLAWLAKKWQERQSRDELSKWADGALAPKGQEDRQEPVPFAG